MSKKFEELIDNIRTDHNGLFIIRETKENKIVTTIINNVNDDCTQLSTHLFMGVELLQESVVKWCMDYIEALPPKITVQVKQVYTYDIKHDVLELGNIE